MAIPSGADAAAPIPFTAADDAGFDVFFGASWHRVCRMLAAVGGDDRDVEDVAQEAFILARHRWADLRKYQKPEAWVMKVALQLLRRWRARERRLASRATAGVQPMFDPFIVDGGVGEMYRAVQRLPRRRAEVTVLHLLGYSIAETAEVLAIHPGTVKSHLCLARRDLRILLGEDQ